MTRYSSQSGFTLIELAVVIAAIGLLVGAYFSFFNANDQHERYMRTIDRQHRIARALSDYAAQHGGLPCAASPNGTPIGEPRTAANCNTNSERNGVVPFRALGLSQEDATDGYGNPFSYYVARTALEPANFNGDVHLNCRVDNIWVSAGANLNKRKAHFCCQRVNTATNQELAIYTETVAPYHHPTNIQDDDSPPLNSADFSAPDSGVSSGTSENLAYFAYILISHGTNGEGSYSWGLSSRKSFAVPGDGERYNADDNEVFFALPRKDTEDNTYFDDIILWRTQQGVINEMGNDSCARP